MMHHNKLSISWKWLFCCLLCSTIFATPISQKNASNAESSFINLSNNYFDNYYFETFPSIATYLGNHRYDQKLEKFSKNDINKQIATLKSFESIFVNVNTQELNEILKADRELILNNIRSQLLTLRTIRPWQKNPDIYSSAVTNSAFLLIERKFASPKKRLAALIAREKKMPAVFKYAQENLKNPPKIFTEIALEQLPSMIEFFQRDVPNAFLDVKNVKLQQEFISSNHAVITALKKYQHWLQHYLLQHSHGDFRLGEHTYQKKLQYDEMVDLPLDKLLQINDANMQANQAALFAIAKEIAPEKSLAEVIEGIQADHPKPQQLLKDFKNTFTEVVQFIEQKKLVTIPSKIIPQMVETPPFMRATTFASMDTPGPFEQHAQEAYFNVTLPDPTWGKDKTEEFMRTFNYASLKGTVIHEAYPGHYIQYLWLHKLNDRTRKILGANSMIEGWAHYCEQMMLDEGFNKKDNQYQYKILRMNQLLDALWRNARFKVAINMHTGKFNFEQAVNVFVNEAYQPRAVGIVESKRATSDPTYLYYTLGKLQILKLRADLQNKLGKSFDLRHFHDSLMQQGFVPLKIVRKTFLHDDSPTL